MLNLLFISNSPKVQYIKSVLQPVLKVIIDVVPDFDHGLKDVFEKRPATVCIQEQIAGVTGESVARHIQMLLGTGSPRFILMHEGSSKAKLIKGLFEHVIDLNQPDASLANNFQDTLESLLGEQWVKIYIPPVQTSASVRSAVSVPEGPQVDADKLVDDFLSDLDTNNFSSAASSAVPDVLGQELTVLSSSDKIAEMLLAQSAHAKSNDTFFGKTAGSSAESGAESVVKQQPSLAANDSGPFVTTPESNKNTSIPSLNKPLSYSQQDSIKSKTVINAASESKLPSQVHQTVSKTSQTSVEVAPSLSSVAAAEFKIKNKKDLPEDLIPEELLIAFEENYRTESAHMKRNILALSVLLIAVIVVGWYFLKQKPHLLDSMKQRLLPAKALVLNQPSAVSPPQKSGQTGPQANPVVTTTLPKFIPMHGHDKTYATKNPGWERYVANNIEFRVFNAGGAIKAVQVLSIKGNVLTEQFLKSVLAELAGSAEYKVGSRKIKSGLTELRGVVDQKADIVIYKNKESVRAFVVSLN